MFLIRYMHSLMHLATHTQTHIEWGLFYSNDICWWCIQTVRINQNDMHACVDAISAYNKCVTLTMYRVDWLHWNSIHLQTILGSNWSVTFDGPCIVWRDLPYSSCYHKLCWHGYCTYWCFALQRQLSSFRRILTLYCSIHRIVSARIH